MNSDKDNILTPYMSISSYIDYNRGEGGGREGGCLGDTHELDFIPYQHIPSGLILWGLIKDWELYIHVNRNKHYS